MHKRESVLENEAHRILCGFDGQTDHQIPASRLDLGLINKKEKKSLSFQLTTELK